jgi:hypothetical protein
METLNRHLVSALVTFVSTFLTTLGFLLIAIPAENWTQVTYASIISGLVLSAVRAAAKVALESFSK